MEVLVTGATGFTGGQLTRKLLERGNGVRALVRPGTDAASLDKLGVMVVRGDLRDPATVDQAVCGVGCVYHIAAAFRTTGKPDAHYYDINVNGTRHVLNAVRKHGTGRLVHCSTIGVHGDVGPQPVDETAPFRPGDIYQTTKLQGEQLVTRAVKEGLPAVVFRPGGIYGPGDTRFLKLFRAVYRRRFVMIGTGKVQYHLVYIDDLTEGILQCGELEAALGQVFILTGEASLSLNTFVQLVGQGVGVRPPRWRVPLGPVLVLARVCEAVCKPLRISPPLYRRRMDFFCKDRTFLIAKAKRELGFSPQVAPAEGLRRTAEWYREEGLL